MNSWLTTSEERDQFLKWLDESKDLARAEKLKAEKARNETDKIFHMGRYQAYLEVLAFIKLKGEL